jgi:hypothetical protein
VELEQFIARVKSRPLSNNPMTRVRTLAKELAEGAVEGVWGLSISSFRGVVNEAPVLTYLDERWSDSAPNLGLLVSNGYLSLNTNPQNSSQATLNIGKSAFDLLEENEPSSIFISYRRDDSSAFALLVLARLKAEGLNAFLDLAIQPGANWRTHIQNEITSRDNLILLLGKQTLSSDVVREELVWAAQSGTNIIPIWHNRYVYRSGEFDLPTDIDLLLQNTHTIRVLEESALGYNNAITELLNRFGITP